ncbi:hypothetical protein [uncultured Selenomonas sp.]|uniref:hypothetical protein n=1 Tax=uncultured Selenomonas sp. TaxID=159275 RepID=UPI0028EECBC0|nr:hypothetical protein [uncultured Selenomonas sp.]
MRKRCIFCLRKLDEKERCRNKKCPDYIRTQILDKADAEKAETQDAAEMDKEEPQKKHAN